MKGLKRMKTLFVLGVIVEILLWVSIAIACCYHHHSDGRIAFVTELYKNFDWLHLILPSLDLSKGYGGLSFTGLATGLNLALVKLDSFRKTLKDVKEAWQEQLDAILDGFSAVRADDKFRVKLDDWVKKEGKSQIDEALSRHKTHGMIWRRFAIRMSVIGFILAFVQMSSGFLGIFFLLPALGWFVSKLAIERTMGKELKVVSKVAKSFENELNSGQTQMREQILQVISDDPKGQVAQEMPPPSAMTEQPKQSKDQAKAKPKRKGAR